MSSIETAKSGHKAGAEAPSIILVGNPNVGKSVIFSLLTGKYVTVSNYPGTTVELSRGTSSFDGGGHTVIDTPGVNSMTPRSEDERVTRNILLAEPSQTVVQVGDAKNLRRTLMLTAQLAEMGVPLVVVLNMMDEARRLSISVNARRLAEKLGVPVVETVATEKVGLNRLIHSLSEARRSPLVMPYDDAIQEAIEAILAKLPDTESYRKAVALMLLAGDADLMEWLKDRMTPEDLAEVESIVRKTAARFGQPLSFVITKERLAWVDAVLQEVFSREGEGQPGILKALGDLSQHPVWGVPIVLVILFIMYEFVGKFAAGTCVDFVQSTVFGSAKEPSGGFDVGLFGWSLFHVPWQGLNWYGGRLAEWIGSVPHLEGLLFGKFGLIQVGLTYAVAIILPVVSMFFLAFGCLEDSGYLPRLTVMVNKIFKRIGLNGKAVLPMVLGLGCDTMATLTTRILDSKKERLISTLLLALAIPCSAQLGVIIGILGKISLEAYVLFMAVIGAQLLIVGYLAAKVIPGTASDFIMEIPPFRLPKLSNVVLKTLYRVEWFMKEAVPLFLLGTFILYVADKLGVLGFVIRLCEPIVSGLLGLPAETATAFVMGFLRRDYGAAGLYQMFDGGMLDNNQAFISLVTITLFVPCIANFFVIIKEQSFKKALAVVGFVFPYAIFVGAALNLVFKLIKFRL